MLTDKTIQEVCGGKTIKSITYNNVMMTIGFTDGSDLSVAIITATQTDGKIELSAMHVNPAREVVQFAHDF